MLVTIAWALIFCGIFFIFSSAIGMLRFNNIYIKAQSGGLLDSFGGPITLVGIALLQNQYINFFKILLLVIIILILNPLITHILLNAAYSNGDK